jgi:hypothetical protein
VAGSSGNKANSAQLELELGLSLAIKEIIQPKTIQIKTMVVAPLWVT